MALVRGAPQLLVETNDKKSIGYEADGRKVALASIDSMAGIQGDMNLAVAASRDASLSDNGNILVCSSADAIVITVKSKALIGWDGAASIVQYRDGVGAVTFAAGAGVTIRGDLSTPAQYGFKGICRIPTKTDEWAVF